VAFPVPFSTDIVDSATPSIDVLEPAARGEPTTP
jgi:hypothetical protein